MSVPNVLTTSRLFLSPLYFIAFFLPSWTGRFQSAGLLILIVVYVLIEVSDVLDGHIARSKDLVSDYGKLMDPFADTVSRLTYFVCFSSVGIMPIWTLMVIIYREFGIVFLRMMMYRRGTALAARSGGKLKATFYAFGGLLGIVLLMVRRTWLPAAWERPLQLAATAVFVVAALLAVISFLDYVRVYTAWRRSEEP